MKKALLDLGTETYITYLNLCYFFLYLLPNLDYHAKLVYQERPNKTPQVSGAAIIDS